MIKPLHDFLDSFVHAAHGIRDTLRKQRNLRIDFLAGIMVLFLAVYLPLSTFEVLWLVFSVFVVIVFEMLNSLLEEMLDLLYPYFHERVGHAKDVSAGIVLVTSIFAFSVGVIILGKQILNTPDIFGVLAFAVFLIFFISLFRKGKKDEE